MHFTFLIILSLVPLVLADDWDDFTNNLATDLVSCTCSCAEHEQINDTDAQTHCRHL